MAGLADILTRGAEEMGLQLTAAQLDTFERFVRELDKWNRKVNLTAMTSQEDVAVKHILDALSLCRLLRGDERLLDIGSGAGVPAIPLKIRMPGLTVSSVDAVGKKVMFQRHVIRLLGLQGIEAVHSRVETMSSAYTQAFDIIVSRAFSRLELFARLALPLVASGGKLVAMKGPAGSDELGEAAEHLSALGVAIESIHGYYLPFGRGERSLIVMTPRQPA